MILLMLGSVRYYLKLKYLIFVLCARWVMYMESCGSSVVDATFAFVT